MVSSPPQFLLLIQEDWIQSLHLLLKIPILIWDDESEAYSRYAKLFKTDGEVNLKAIYTFFFYPWEQVLFGRQQKSRF